MATRQGTVKKTAFSEFQNIRANGIIAIKLVSTDELAWVKPTTGKSEIILISKMGHSIRFNEEDVRETGAEHAEKRDGDREQGTDVAEEGPGSVAPCGHA